MAALFEPRRALVAASIIAIACSTYEPGLLQPASSGTSGNAGQSGSSGGTAGDAAVAGTAGDAVSGGTAGTAAAGAPDAGQPAMPDTLPYVTGIIGAPSISVGLTFEGSLDWAHWGLKLVTDRNQKSIAVSQLLDFKPTGSAAMTRYLDGPTTFAWSDGKPTASASTNDGISWTGVGEGFQLKVPAGNDVRKLRLYVGIFGGTAVVKGALSDPRANSTLVDRVSSDTAAWVLQVVTVEYGFADLPNTTLSVSVSIDKGSAAGAAVSLTALSIGPN